MTERKEGHFEFLEGFPRDVVAFAAKGFIDAEDYEKTLIPEIEARIRQEGKVKLLYVLGPEFEGFSAGAAWDDARLGLTHIGDFPRIAVISDREWIRAATRMFAPLVASEVEAFSMDQMEAAKAWIIANRPPDEEGPEVAADYTIPPLEDKIPPVG